MQTMRSPSRRSSRSIRRLPMNPAPPVTRTFIASDSHPIFQAEPGNDRDGLARFQRVDFALSANAVDEHDRHLDEAGLRALQMPENLLLKRIAVRTDGRKVQFGQLRYPIA